MSRLPALLNILQNPSSPAYQQALQQLENLTEADFPSEALPALLAQLESTILSLTHQRTEIAEQLEATRTRAQAINAYKR